MTDSMQVHFSGVKEFYQQHIRKKPLFVGIAFLAITFATYAVFSGQKELTNELMNQIQQILMGSGAITEDGGISFLGLLLNNWIAMLVCIAYGFLPFLFLPVLAVLSNAAVIGLVAAWYAIEGVPMEVFLAGILPHGIFELAALFLSVSCGIALCKNIVGRIVRNDSSVPMVEFLIGLMQMVLFVIFPLILGAAIIECYITPFVMGAFLP